jgi:hypothetical protein
MHQSVPIYGWTGSGRVVAASGAGKLPIEKAFDPPYMRSFHDLHANHRPLVISLTATATKLITTT